MYTYSGMFGSRTGARIEWIFVPQVKQRGRPVLRHPPQVSGGRHIISLIVIPAALYFGTLMFCGFEILEFRRFGFWSLGL